jgi:hypothetical protein
MKKTTQTLLALMAVHGVLAVAQATAPGATGMHHHSKPLPDGNAAFTEAVERDFRQLTDLVWRAIDDRSNSGKALGERDYVELVAIYADRAVVRYKDRWFSYGYSVATKIDGSETVSLTSPIEVVQQYVPAGDPIQKMTEALHFVPKEVDVASLATGGFTEAADGSIAVTLIRSGASLNGNYYGDAALRAAVPLFEGVRVFAKSDADHTKGGGKDVRNLIGGVYSVKFVEGAGPDTGALVGTFKAIDPSDAVATKMVEAVKRGMQGLMGLSIDAVALTKKRTQGGKTLREATKFTKVNSVDLIVEPGAGGGLDRLTEAAAENLSLTTGDDAMKTRMLEAIKAKNPALFATIDQATVTDDKLMAMYEAVCAAAPAVPAAATTAQQLTESAQDAPVTRAELAMLQTRANAVRRVTESKLPAPAKQRLLKRFENEARFAEADVDAAIKDEGDYLGKFTESGSARVPMFGVGSIQVGDRSVAMKDMLDAFFDPAHKDHKQVRSFKECYVQMTGDREITGDLRKCDLGLMRESFGEDFREAVASTTFANAMGNSITRRMQTIYAGLTNLQSWRNVATVTQVNDFRTQERVRIGGYGNLPIVAESGPYTALTSPGDEKATYAVAKRGGTETVTIEAIINDDVQAIRRIPLEMALSAANTLYEFVFDFYRTNPVIYDSAALYTAPKGNLFTGALSAAELSLHRLAVLKATRAGSAKRLATPPKTLLVPFELQETAVNLFNRNTNLDKTFLNTLNLDVLAVSYWTDPNDWHTVCDQMYLPTLEIGFLNGKEEPELFVQDMPNVGSLFNNDVITYKLRHVYGGAVPVDGFKGTTKAVVP